VSKNSGIGYVRLEPPEKGTEMRNPAVWATCYTCGGKVHRTPLLSDSNQRHGDLADCVQYLASELRRLQKPE
jgi:hypothetical protein